MVIKMKNYIKVEIPAKPENERLARTVCAAFVLDLDPTVEEMSEIKTAVSEAVTNSIIHGYEGTDGKIEIYAEMEDEAVTYKIKDFGCGIANIEKAKEPLYSGKKNEERSGMGFSIMEAFMDELRVESVVGEGTTVIMRKRFMQNEKQ